MIKRDPTWSETIHRMILGVNGVNPKVSKSDILRFWGRILDYVTSFSAELRMCWWLHNWRRRGQQQMGLVRRRPREGGGDCRVSKCAQQENTKACCTLLSWLLDIGCQALIIIKQALSMSSDKHLCSIIYHVVTISCDLMLPGNCDEVAASGGSEAGKRLEFSSFADTEKCSFSSTSSTKISKNCI